MALTTQQQTDAYRFFAIAFGAAPGYTYMSQIAEAYAAGMTTLQIVEVYTTKPQYQAIYPTYLTNAQFAASLIDNVVGDSASTAAKNQAKADVEAALNGGWSQGKVITQIFTNLANKSPSDPLWGQTSIQLANQVAVAKYYTEVIQGDTTDMSVLQAVLANVTNLSDVSTPAKIQSIIDLALANDTFELTTGTDDASGYHLFESAPDYTPGGNDFVNTLQDEDSLTGTSANDDALHVTLGSVNDAAESIVSPSLTSIEIVRAEITGGSDAPAGLDFEDAEGVRELHVDRITANNQEVVFQTLQQSTDTVSLSNATRNGVVEFNWAEGALSGSDDSLDLTLNEVVQSTVAITTGDGMDQPEDELYSFEQVDVHVNGSTNVDVFYVAPNAEEDVRNGDDQRISIDNNARLEINQFIATGAETVDLAAGANVYVTLNERENEEGNDNVGLDLEDAANGDDKAVQLSELLTLNITGSGKVTINGLNGDSVYGVDVNGGTMTGTLALRVDDVVAVNGLSSVTSGSAADEIITTIDTAMDITTNAGADHIKILDLTGEDESDLTGAVYTGSGADILLVEGNIEDTIVDTGSVEDTATHGDRVTSQDVVDSDILTGAGNDTITVWGDVVDITGADNVITTGSENDLLDVDGNITSGYAVNTGSGNDTVTLDADHGVQDLGGTITTETGDDRVLVGESGDSDVDANGNIDLGVGNDYLYINDDLDAVVTAGTVGETDADGKDTVEIGDDIYGEGTVTSGGGADSIHVGGSLLVANEDDVSRNGVTTETTPGGTLNAKGAGKTADNTHVDVTVAALVDSGAGNDVVAIDGTLESGMQWNDNAIDSAGSGNRNVDDTITVVGATVRLGEGDDTLTLGDYADRSTTLHGAVMEEQSLVEAAGGNDAVTVNHNGPVVLAADNSAFLAGGTSNAGNPSVAVSYTSREATSATTASTQDTLGAKIDLGTGNDTVTFNDVPFDVDPAYAPNDSANTYSGSTTIVDRGALLAGGAGSDVLNVTTVDTIDVVTSRYWHAIDTADLDSLTDTIVVGGLNAKDYKDGQGGYITGIETINLTIENTVGPDEIIYGADGNDDYGVADRTATDNDSTEGAAPDVIRLDVYQVDTDLDVINLKSNEQRLAIEPTGDPLVDVPGEAEEEDPDLLDGYDNGWMAGDDLATFEIDNLRSDVALTLAAYEATGVTPWHIGDEDEDTILDSGETWGEGYETRDDCETDVTVEVNMDRYVAGNNGFVLTMLANAPLSNQAGEANYDVEIISEDEYAAGATSPVLTQEDDVVDLDYVHTDGLIIGRYAREITLNIDTGASHAIDLDRTFVGADDDNVAGEATTLTVNGTSDGQTIELNDVRADRIDVNGDAEIWLYTQGSNAFNISTGSGDDVINMARGGDDFDYDTVDGGAGYDTLILAGGTDVNADEFGNLDNVENVAFMFQEGTDATSSIYVDSWADVEKITIFNENNSGSDDGIADEDDDAPGEDGTHTVNVETSHGLPAGTRGSLVIDADSNVVLDPAMCNEPEVDRRHSDNLVLNIDTTVGDGSGAARLTDVTAYVNVAEGTQVNLNNHSGERFDLEVTVSALADTEIDSDNLGDDEGELQLVNGDNGVDSITLRNNEEDGQGAENNNVFVVVDDGWAGNVNTVSGASGLDILIDASDISDTNESVWNVLNELDGSAETDANLHIIGTQDADDITGGARGDSLDGQDGEDLIYGRQGADSISGGNGDDQIAADEDGCAISDGAADIVDGGAGDDLIYGGVGADTLTGGSGDDVFVYTRRIDSNGLLVNTDLITDFNSAADDEDLEDGHDVIDLRYLVYDPLLTAMLDGKPIAFGAIDPLLGQLGGNAVDYADATAAVHNGNEVIEIVYQQDQSVLWVDLNDDGSLDNNDLRIRVNLQNGATTLTWENIVGLDDDGMSDDDFFGPIHSSDPDFVGGTVLDDHIIIDDGPDLDGYADGLDWPPAEGGLALFGGDDEVIVDGNFNIVIDGGDGDDTVNGGGGNETIYGGFGNDSINGNGGDDSIVATPGNDTVWGGTGEDTIYTGDDADTVYGNEGDDLIFSGNGDDYVVGGEGNDDIDSGNGDDTVHGDNEPLLLSAEVSGNYDDHIDAGNGDDLVTGGMGHDTIHAGEGEDTVWGGSGNDFVDANDGDDVVAGNEGDDTVYGGYGNDLIDGGDAQDDIDGGNGDDTVSGNAGDDWVYGSNGDDVVTGDLGDDTLGGGNGDDWMTGGDGNDDIYAHNGDDLVTGGDGDDAVLGGDGNDDIAGNDGDDTLVGQGGDDWMTGGDGNDDIHGDSASEFYHDGEFEQDLAGANGPDGDDTIYAGAGDDWADGNGGDDFIDGGTGNDDLYGNSGDDSIVGGDGDDWIEGEDGADLLEGNDGDDSMFGGAYTGYSYADGDDTINGGNGNDWIGGNDGDDQINGGVGNDYIEAGDGDDTVFGGENTLDPVDDDTIYGGWGNDVLDGVDGDDDISGGEGNDDIQGGDGFDYIGGNEGDDYIDASEDDDTVYGGNGDDTIRGGTGNDLIEADDYEANGDGDDVVYGDEGHDRLMAGNGDDWIDGGTGNDDIYGDGDDDTLYGADGDDSIQGEGGADTIDGGNGDDTIQGGNADESEDADEGDSIDGGNGDDVIWGNEGDDTVDGGANDDTIYGGTGNDDLSGGDHDDSVYGNEGDDSIYGGDGDDFLTGEIDDDTVTVGGNDYIEGGLGNDYGSGDGGNDTIAGNEGDDDLFGDAGDDSILGGSGNDSIEGEAGADDLFGGSGNDTIYGNADDSIGVDLGDYIEGGSGNDDIWGDDGDDTIYGDDAPAEILADAPVATYDDSIYGGWGNDVIDGGLGDDYIEDGEDSDTIVGGDGNDEVWLLNDYDTDEVWVDKDDTGTDSITGTFDVDAPSSEGDLLVLQADDVTWGETGGRVNLFYYTNGANDDTTNIGLLGESVANGRIVTIDSDITSFTVSGLSGLITVDITTADGIDDLLAAQNGSFGGSVYVMSDDGTTSYVWYDDDVNSNDGGVQLVATIAVGNALTIADDNLAWYSAT